MLSKIDLLVKIINMQLKIRECVKKIEPYNPGKPIEEVQRELGIPEVIKLASNENPLGPAPKALQAIHHYATETNLYPEGSGYYLRKKLASRLGIAEEQIILGNGSDEIVTMLCQTFVNPGDEAVIGDPAFLRFQQAVELMDGRSALVPLRDNRHDLIGMANAVTDKTKLIFIANPNNPTGTIVTQEEVDAFMEKIPPWVVVVFDEAYYEYVTASNYPKTIYYLRKYKNVIILRTFSKIYGLAGVRVGYGLANEELISLLNRIRPPFNVNRLAQYAAIAALDDDEHVTKSLINNNEGKIYLYNALDNLGLPYLKTEANFILIDLKQDAQTIFKKLLKKGIIVRVMDMYNLPNHIRVTIGTKEQLEKFISALSEVI